ncbi:MAG: restriction endonuclease subunit S [Lachnospira sp.]|nr:restriction endonuclease subunit S [Lachnospira sp.]
MVFNRIKLGDVCNIINGRAFKSKEFQENGVPVIKIANVKPNKILLTDLKCVSEEVAEKNKGCAIQFDDILLTMTGNRMDGGPDSWVGKAALFRENGHYMLNQRLCIIRPDRHKLDTRFLGYVLSSWDAQLYFIKRATSSGGQANISPAIIKDYDIPFPDLNIQKKISLILDTLDLKIRNNEKINKNLAA